jgi:hypothetical protein
VFGVLDAPESDVGEADRMVAVRLRQYRLMHVTDVERLVEVFFRTLTLGKLLLLLGIGLSVLFTGRKDLCMGCIAFFISYGATELLLSSL